MQDTAKVPRKPDGDQPAGRPLIDEQLADDLLGKAQAQGVELLRQDGLLSQLTEAVLERGLAEEMTGHLGYEKHDPAGSRVNVRPVHVALDRCRARKCSSAGWFRSRQIGSP
jgi:putative transposase